MPEAIETKRIKLISSLRTQRTRCGVINVLKKSLGDVGISGFHFQLCPKQKALRLMDFSCSTLPAQYQSEYKEWGLDGHDLRLEHAIYSQDFLFNSQFYKHIDNSPFCGELIFCVKKLCEMEKRHGIQEGVCIPAHAKSHPEAAVLMVYNHENAKSFRKRVDAQREFLELLATQFYEYGYARFLTKDQKKPEIKLTRRQRQTLLALAKHNFNSNRAGDLLCRSPRTVEKHAERVRAAYGVNTTFRALQIAISMGEFSSLELETLIPKRVSFRTKSG